MTPALTRRAAVLGSLASLGLRGAATGRQPKIAIFSKHLHFIGGAELARTVSELGFDGIDLTVRKGGHVEPAKVAQDLPPLVALIRKQGLEVPMVTTDIVDASSANARAILKTLAELHIRHYRWGGFKYTNNQPLRTQLDDFHRRSAQLAALNSEFQVCAIYHTHSGVNLVGAPVWDMVEILKGLDPNVVAINYDVGHATVEGGLGGWMDSFRIAEPCIRGLAFKDFIWQKDSHEKWEPEWVPLGTGMVRFPAFFALLAKSGFDGPIQLHFEYPLGGADEGKRQLSISRDQVFAAMRRDLRQLRQYFSDATSSHA